MKAPEEFLEGVRKHATSPFKWEIGDEVRLKSGGVAMTVSGRTRNRTGAYITVQWTDWSSGPPLMQTDQFDQRLLVTFPREEA